MAMMRTNRLTSKTTPPKTRKMVPASDLEAQDASYKKYQEDVKSYGSKLDKYNKDEELYKKSPRSYANWGGIQGTRELNKAELADFNKAQDGTEYDWVRTSKDFKGNASNISGFHGGMKKPTAPKRSEPADWSAVQLDKMPTKKATSIETNRSLKGPKERKTATEGWFGDVNPNTAGTSNKQLKQFASYASKTGLGESFIAKPKTAINEYKGEMKSQRKEYAKEGNKAGVKATTADIRQARSAAKFTGSNNPLDVPGMATGYRAAQDNAANRNTIKAQVSNLKKLR
jgi:hypothetical protein